VNFEGTVSINASQEKVWAHLIDPNFVAQCAPGLVSMEILEPDKLFRVVAGIGLGSVKVTFDAQVAFLELIKPEYARLKAHGMAPGSAVDVTSEMRLTSPAPNTTDLAWTADVVVVGSIANLASRLMGGVTKKLSSAFFDCVKEKIEESTKIQA
jgi:carbon monoxide dehydrogenase subunit G